MNFQFKYACSCTKPKSIAVDEYHNIDYQRQLKERVNEILDRSWDETDPSILTELTMFSRHITLNDGVHENTADSIMPDCEKSIAIIKSVSNRSLTPGCPCACEAIAHTLAIVLNAGLAEVAIEPIREESLLEKVHLLKPFVSTFQDDVSLHNFFIRTWKQAVRFYCPKLVAELAQVYPQFLQTLIDELLNVQYTDYEGLQSLSVFQLLSRCLTIGESFYAILSYLATQNRVRAQPLISACVRAAKDQLNSKAYYALFPPRVKPYAIVMNEIIDPKDADIKVLIGELRKEHPHDYRILIAISPVFCGLEDALPESNDL